MIKKILINVILVSLIVSCKSLESSNNAINEKLSNALKTENYENIESLLILKDNETLYEYYADNIDNASQRDIASSVKTITSILIGIAIDNDFISSVDDKFYTYFPEYEDEIKNEKFKSIKIRDLLAMSDGIEWDPKMDWKNITAPDVKSNPVLFSFKQDINNDYLGNFRYSSLNSQLLSALISKTTGMSMDLFAQKYLFNYLQVENYSWSSDDNGNTHGGFGLKISGKDMLQIAKLLLNNGVINGKTIVSKKWINEMITIQNNGDGKNPGKYGLHVWVDDSKSYLSYYAMGYGGQFMYIIPEYNIAAIITSNFSGHRIHHKLIIDEIVIPQ